MTVDMEGNPSTFIGYPFLGDMQGLQGHIKECRYLPDHLVNAAILPSLVIAAGAPDIILVRAAGWGRIIIAVEDTWR